MARRQKKSDLSESEISLLRPAFHISCLENELEDTLQLSFYDYPHFLVAAQSGHGKTYALSQFIRSLKANEGSDLIRIIYLDPKGGRELPPDVRAAIEIIDFDKNPDKAISALDSLEQEVRVRGDLQSEAKIDGEWWKALVAGVPTWESHGPLLLICDEASRLLDEVKTKKALTPEEELRLRFQEVIATGLERWRSAHISIALLLQSARASKLKTILEASDNIKLRLYGPTSSSMALAIGHRQLHEDPSLRQPGTFLLDDGLDSQTVRVIAQPALLRKDVTKSLARPHRAGGPAQGAGADSQASGRDRGQARRRRDLPAGGRELVYVSIIIKRELDGILHAKKDNIRPTPSRA